MTRPRLVDQCIWVLWRRERTKDGFTKRPYNPITCQRAEPDNPATWANLAEVEDYLARMPGIMEGYGPMLGEPARPETWTGLVFIDLDHCRNAQTGAIEEWALTIVKALNSLTEISSSGEGLHVLCWGTKPGERCVLNDPLGSTHPKAKVEV